VFDAAGDLAETHGVDLSSVLTGDPVADRALLEAGGVEAEIEASGVSLEGALDLVEALVRFAGVFASTL
jgi:hypothetical protein